jgi:hypothetical protein
VSPVDTHAVFVRNTPPSVVIVTPTNGSSVNGHVVVSGHAYPAFDGGAVVEVSVFLPGFGIVHANGTTNWSVEWNTIPLPPGPATIVARSYDGMLYSAPAFDRVTIVHPAVDLAAVSIRVDRTPIQTDFGSLPNELTERRVVSITVANLGTAPSNETQLTLVDEATAYVPGTTTVLRTAAEVGTVDVAPLQPGETRVLTFAWDTTGKIGDQTLVGTIDPFYLHYDTNRSNNVITWSGFVDVGGLGGVATPTPLTTPSPDAPGATEWARLDR